MLLTKLWKLLLPAVAIAAIYDSALADVAAVYDDGTIVQAEDGCEFDDVGNRYEIIGDMLVVSDNATRSVLHTEAAQAVRYVRPLGGAVIELESGNVRAVWPRADWFRTTWQRDIINSSEKGDWYRIANEADIGWESDRFISTVGQDNRQWGIEWERGVAWVPTRFVLIDHWITPGYPERFQRRVGVATLFYIMAHTNGPWMATTAEYNGYITAGDIPVTSGGRPPSIVNGAITGITFSNDMACIGVTGPSIPNNTTLHRVEAESAVWIPSHGVMVDPIHYTPYAARDFGKFFHGFYSPDGEPSAILGITQVSAAPDQTRLVCATAEGRMFWTTPMMMEESGGEYFDGDVDTFNRVSACGEFLIYANRVSAAPWATPRGPSPDINRDGVVDTADLGLLLARFDTSDPFADLNVDGTVDSADLGILLDRFGDEL